LRRLKTTKQVLPRLAPDGATVYVLAQAGAKRLGAEADVNAKSGKDLIRNLGNYEHRCRCNEFAIDQLLEGNRVYTEREIQAGQAPFKNVLHKTPDGLVFDKQDRHWFGWVEVERGYKKTADFQKMLRFIYHVLGGCWTRRQTQHNAIRGG
jgi:hypothetical protein